MRRFGKQMPESGGGTGSPEAGFGIAATQPSRAVTRAASLFRGIGRGLRLLYFRPSRFLAEYPLSTSPRLSAFFAWTYGMASIIDAQAMREARGKEPFFSESWIRFWTFTVAGGIVAGLVIYRFGGWWYELRLWMSGVNPIDARAARAVYLSTSQIEVIPLLLWCLGETLYFARPPGADDPPTVWVFVLLVFPFWAIRASHIGVNSVFRGSRPLTLIWFLILPFLVRLFGVLAVLATAHG